MRRVLLLAVFGLCLSCMPATAQSIVGSWCGDGLKTVIGPLSLKNDDASCTFKSARRKGNTVTFRGVCDDAEGGGPNTVVATLKAGKLTYRFVTGGNVIGPLTRCK